MSTACNLDVLFNFMLQELHRNHRVQRIQVLPEFFQIGLHVGNWHKKENFETLKSKKAVEMRNDSPAEASGKLETKPGSQPTCNLTFTQGFVVDSQRTCQGCDFQACLSLPPCLYVPKEYESHALRVNLADEVQEVPNPIRVEASLDLDLPSGQATVGEVEVHEVIYKGTFDATAKLKFKMRAHTNNGETIDVKQSDAANIKKVFPPPFSYDEESRRIVWDVRGSLNLRFDHKKILKIV